MSERRGGGEGGREKGPNEGGNKGRVAASWATNSAWLKLGTCDGSIHRKDGDSPQGLSKVATVHLAVQISSVRVLRKGCRALQVQ